MKTRTRTPKLLNSLLAALGGAAVLLGVLAPLNEAAAQGIRDTRHNLSSTNAIAGANKFSGTDEVCVFCHTPHAANTSSTVNPPLWNRSTSASATYTTYSSSTMEATTSNDASGAIGSVSIACLSCHDGTQAMNTLINQPGSGLTNATYGAGTWTGPALTASPVGSIGATVGNLGTNLANDHPIGIGYCGFTAVTGSGAAATLTCGDTDFVAPKAGLIGGQTVFWVGTDGTPLVRNKVDLPLYNRSFAAASGPSVECGTCHDPHVKDVAGSNPTFLRIANTGSAVCLACHVK